MDLLDPYNFFFEVPLYTKIIVDEDNFKSFFSLMLAKDPIDAYNPILKQETTYIITHNPAYSTIPAQKREIDAYTRDILSFEVRCVRNDFRIRIYVKVMIVDYDEEHDKIKKIIVTKIGQHPSIADLHISKIKEYDKVLSNDKLREISKAVGLAANGVGIGSFVYLRRVFEYLIEEAHKLAKNDDNWNEVQYDKNRMTEKINQLKHHLPSFLVENKNLYAILSKGIHELEENECLEYFEAVKVGIELILDEKVDEFNKKKKIEDAKKRIQNIERKIENNAK